MLLKIICSKELIKRSYENSLRVKALYLVAIKKLKIIFFFFFFLVVEQIAIKDLLSIHLYKSMKEFIKEKNRINVSL